MYKRIFFTTLISVLFLCTSKVHAQRFNWIEDFDENIDPKIEIIFEDSDGIDDTFINFNSNSINETGNKVVEIAQNYIGVPYIWGGVSPNGFDCSGFVQYVYNKTGKKLPRVTTEQEKCGHLINIKDACAGDLYFWGKRGHSYHVAIACGNGKFIQAPAPGQYINYSNIFIFKPDFAIRLE